MAAPVPVPATAAGPAAAVIQVVAEVETQDPDDVLALLWLLANPRIFVHGVVVMPGAEDQVRLISWLLEAAGRWKVPVGRSKPARALPRSAVSRWHHSTFGTSWVKHEPAEVREGQDLIHDIIAHLGGDELTVYTGCAPYAFGTAAQRTDKPLKVGRWLAQGGFAGDNVVPPEHRLAKFAGLEVCPTFNFGGAPTKVEQLLAADWIKRRLLISKNVCHGVLAEFVRPHIAEPSALDRRTRGQLAAYDLFYTALMTLPGNKALHDLLAVATLADESVVTMREVECYRQRGAWGSRLRKGTRTWITTSYDPLRLSQVLSLTA